MRALAIQLLSRRGYEVVTADDGTEAIDMLATHDPDLVITDLNMPRQNGQEVCAAVRRSPRLHKIPLVILTAVPLTDERVMQVASDNNAIAVAKTDIRRLPDLADELIDAA
jgi:CheY-like chemotaxis protein